MSIYSFNKPEAEATEAKPVPVNPDQTPIENEAVSKMAKQEGKESGKEKVVVIDGPLSHVYTQALNIALANESVAFMLNARVPDSPPNDSATGDELKKAEYVYVLGDKITDEGMAMEAFNHLNKAIQSGKYNKVHLAFEGASTGNMCRRLESVMESAMKIGVNVIAKGRFGMEAAIDSLSSALRSKNV